MSYRDATYVIFDGENDHWAYQYMRGWRENERLDFDFRDAHDLTGMTARAHDEGYVKSHLLERMEGANQVIVLVGENTKYLHKFVTWEIELAIDFDLAIIVSYLKPNQRQIDQELCPVALRDHCAVHTDFKMRIIQHALDNWPPEYRRLSHEKKLGGPRYYGPQVYRSLGL